MHVIYVCECLVVVSSFGLSHILLVVWVTGCGSFKVVLGSPIFSNYSFLLYISCTIELVNSFNNRAVVCNHKCLDSFLNAHLKDNLNAICKVML